MFLTLELRERWPASVAVEPVMSICLVRVASTRGTCHGTNFGKNTCFAEGKRGNYHPL